MVCVVIVRMLLFRRTKDGILATLFGRKYRGAEADPTLFAVLLELKLLLCCAELNSYCMLFRRVCGFGWEVGSTVKIHRSSSSSSSSISISSSGSSSSSSS